MTTQPSRLHLFQAYGIELEYMIVDRDTLKARPISDDLLKHELGDYGSDFENGLVTWSNELVMHVIEIKSTRPESNLNTVCYAFAENVSRINNILSTWNAMLMPSAAHPLMDPSVESKLWPHDNNDVYDLYNKIFNCSGHGWSNLQSTHLNLPFYDDEEFAKLHAAVRIVLPLLPAICASSPILDGKLTDDLDGRLKFYKTNQARIPSITGRVIPEAVFSKRNYINTIYEKIRQDIAPFDSENILNPIWVNSRGAIPRFDRGSIEIRLMDIQECPAADIAVVSFVIEIIKALVSGQFAPFDFQMKWRTEQLSILLEQTIKSGQAALIDNQEYLNLFGLKQTSATMGELVRHICNTMMAREQSTLKPWENELEIIFNQGTLANRILDALKGDYSVGNIKAIYRQLSGCLAQNRMFIP
jgi:gamma-glutamyl:cysteine ligase YbdK (ATP-grasp superfamily)